MWLYLIVAVLALVAIVGSVLGGGAFTIVLVPLAVIGIVSAIVSSLLGSSAGVSAGEPEGRAGPTRSRSVGDGGRAPTSPERLADARRVQQ
jgi:hypothetical protein